MPYYHESDTYDGDAYVINGYMPAFINDERAELLIVFDNEHPDGVLTGWRRVYKDGETETVAKASEVLEIGDTIKFVCDYYDYDGNYSDSYYFGEPMVYDGTFDISYVYIDETRANATFLITDLYNTQHWTDVIPKG